MTGQQMREALHAGLRVYGSALGNPLPWAINPYTQLDFVFIDNEHTPLGRESTMALCQAYKARTIAPVVRIPVADPARACMTLDGGAVGIICPYMEDPEQVRQMVGAVKYRPLKGEKLQDLLHGRGGVADETVDYLHRWNRDNVLIINIESRPAIDRLEELVRVDGLDAILIGPHDLSINLDMPEDYENPTYVAAVERIIATARAAGIGAGIHYWQSLEREKHYIEKGANLIVHASDVGEASKAINTALADLRSTFGDAKSADGSDETTI